MKRAALVVLAILGGRTTFSGAQGQPGNRTALLLPIDSVRIAETDTVMLSRPSGIISAPSGHYFIGDGREGRILEVARSGKIVRVLGRLGRGPGELESPGSMALAGDSVLAVMDNGQRRVNLYDLQTGKYRTSFVVIGWRPSLRFSGSALAAGYVQADSGAALERLSPSGQRLGIEGAIPPLLQRWPMLQSVAGRVTFTEVQGEVYAVFEVSQSIYHWKPGAHVAEELSVPALHRKGVRPEIFEEALRDPSKAATVLYDRSIPQLLSAISARSLALVTTDGEFEKNAFVGTHSVTVIDLDRQRACPDLTIPAPRNPLPEVALRGDTVIVLQQGEDANGQPAAAIRRFLIRTRDCEWKAFSRVPP